MTHNLKNKNSLLLASSSPRRISLLSDTRIEFTVVSPESSVEEGFSKVGSPKEVAMQIAKAKALSILQTFPERIVLAAVMSSKVEKVENVVTEVEFRKLNSIEIQEYIAENESLDKAGGYAIQGKGYFLVDKINGSYTNIIGFPIKEILKVLKEFGISSNVDNMEL